MNDKNEIEPDKCPHIKGKTADDCSRCEFLKENSALKGSGSGLCRYPKSQTKKDMTMKKTIMTGIELITVERKRQIEEEGWTAEHDDKWGYGQLANAAACYAMTNQHRICWAKKVGLWAKTTFEVIWPFSKEWWKPTPEDRIRELVKAGALAAAEIDRLQRLKDMKKE
jgi:hypothetical protein